MTVYQVPPTGNPHATIALVGEAPGEDEIERLRENDVAAALEALAKYPDAECVCLEPPVECSCCFNEGWKCFYDALGGYTTGKTAIEAISNASAALEAKL